MDAENDDDSCALVIRPVTASGNSPPSGLLVWVTAPTESPRSQVLGANEPGARFDALPCGPATYGLFLSIPDVFEASRPLARGSIDRLGRNTLVEPVIPELSQLRVEVVTTAGDAVESRVSVFSRLRDANPRYHATMSTDETGHASFIVPSGSYALLASEANEERFVLAEVNGQSVQRPVFIDLQADAAVRFVVHPDSEDGIPVQGQLVDAQGGPVAGPTVVFHGAGDNVHAPTDKAGAFHAELPLFGFPWTTDLDDDSGRWRIAERTQLVEPPRERLVLTAASVGPRVRGNVMDEDGALVSRAWIVMEGCADDDAFRHYAISLASGEFEVGCNAECSMAIEVSADDLLTHQRVLTPGTCDGEPLEIRLRRGTRLTGKVTTEDGLPAAGISLGAVGPGTDEVAHTAADGSYELRSLAPGRVRIQMFDTSGYYQDHSLKMKGPSGETLEAAISIDSVGEIHRDLVIIAGGAICFDMPEYLGTSSLALSLLNRLMVIVFDDVTNPRSPVRKLLYFKEERAIGCVHGIPPGLVRVLVLDNAEPAKVAPAWAPDDHEPGVLEVEVQPGGQHRFDLSWQPQCHIGFQLPKADLEIQAVRARARNDSGEWDPWAPVPLQRLIAFDSDVAQWKLQHVVDLEATVNHSIMLAPGTWQIRIDGIDAEDESLSYASPALETAPGAIVLGTLSPYSPDGTTD